MLVEVLRKRLGKLDEYLAILRKMRGYSFDEFACDPERYGSAERFLQLAIESLGDLGSHLIADHALGMVDSHADIPRILAEKGYIDAAARETWIQMIGFRNVLVQEYLDIDRKLVHEVLQRKLDDIDAIKRVFAGLL